MLGEEGREGAGAAEGGSGCLMGWGLFGFFLLLGSMLVTRKTDLFVGTQMILTMTSHIQGTSKIV